MELLNSIGLSIVAFLVVLGVMIFIHELGHYLMAIYLGIGVETFSLGFGPRLIGFRRGQTDYRISLLPLGGYVKMSGETYDEELTGAEEEFLSRPKLHRFAVTLAGPVMNIGLALVLGTVTYMIGLSMPAYLSEAAQIGRVAEDSAAQEAGLLSNDTIVAIDGDPMPTWREVEIEVVTSPGRSLLFSIDREGILLRKEITPRSAGRQELGTIGVMPYIPYIIDHATPDGPAARAGLLPGDEILDVQAPDGSMAGRKSISDFISARQNQPLLFRIQRGEQILERTIAPVEMDGHIRIGIVFAPAVRTEKFGILRCPAQVGRTKLSTHGSDLSNCGSHPYRTSFPAHHVRTHRDRTLFGRCGRPGSASPHYLHGAGFPAVGNFQPATHSHPGRRSDRPVGGRRDIGSRSQHARKGTHFSGGFHLPDSADGYRHLQRPFQEPFFPAVDGSGVGGSVTTARLSWS